MKMSLEEIEQIYRETQDDHGGCLGNKAAIQDFARRYAKHVQAAILSPDERDELQALRIIKAHIAEVERELYAWRRALNDCTPGGSEFANDPENCKEWVRKARQTQHETIIRFKEARDAAEAALRSRDEAVREATETVSRLRLNLKAVADTLRDHLHPETTLERLVCHDCKDIVDTAYSTLKETGRPAAERLEKIVGQEGKR